MKDITKPLIDIPIPGPFILLGIFPLTLLYIAIVCFDYYLYCQTSIPYQKYKNWHCLFHVLIPFIFSPKLHQLSTVFQAFPWFVASVGAYSSQLYKYQQLKLDGPPQSFKAYLISIGIEGLAQQPNRQPNGTTLTKRQVRIEGLRRLLNDVIAMALASKFLTPLLLQDPDTLFSLNWYSMQCIWFGFLMGFKGYTLMLCTDIGLAIGQIMSGFRILHVFDLPFLASSPKEFWGNRWNLIVRNLFRKQLYTGMVEKKKSNLASKRLRAFIISGVMHETIMTLANRNITLEQFSFFLIHGLAVNLQSMIPYYISKRVPKVLSIILTMMFFGCTSKLFIGPFLRFEDQCSLFGQQAFI